MRVHACMFACVRVCVCVCVYVFELRTQEEFYLLLIALEGLIDLMHEPIEHTRIQQHGE